MRTIFRILAIILLLLCLHCGGDEKQSETDSSDVVSEPVDSLFLDESIFADFSISGYIDTVSGEPQRVAAMFLKASLLDGDYSAAAEFLCEGNREIIRKDSLMDYVAYGRNNPDWDELTELRYSVTRRYIPVLTKFNDVSLIRQVSCDSICRIEYNVTGPLFVNKVFDLSLGENGKSKFDRVMDSSLALDIKRDFYDYAFTRLEKMADSMVFHKRKTTDTLTLIKEEGVWKVCKIAETSFQIFSQQ